MDQKNPYLGFREWTRHSLVLTVTGVIFVATGIAYINEVVPEGRAEALAVIVDPVPFAFWGSLFVMAGLLAIVSSIWPRHIEKWGYQVLTGLSASWAAAYVLGILFGDSPWSNITNALIWSFTAFVLWAVSGLLDPPTTVIIEVISDAPQDLD